MRERIMREKIKLTIEKIKQIIMIISCLLGLMLYAVLSIPLAFSYLLMLKPRTASETIEYMLSPRFNINDIYMTKKEKE